MSSDISISAVWTCHACYATAESSQRLTVLDMALGARIAAPRGWTQTNLHAFCSHHGDPLPAAAYRVEIPATLGELDMDLRRAAA